MRVLVYAVSFVFTDYMGELGWLRAAEEYVVRQRTSEEVGKVD